MCHQASRSQGSPKCTLLSEPARKGFGGCSVTHSANGETWDSEKIWGCWGSGGGVGVCGWYTRGSWYMTQQWQIDAIQRLCRHTDCVPASKGEPAASSHSAVRLCGALGVGLCSRLWAYTASAGCQACLPCPGELSWSPPTSRCFPNVKILPTQT